MREEEVGQAYQVNQLEKRKLDKPVKSTNEIALSVACIEGQPMREEEVGQAYQIDQLEKKEWSLSTDVTNENERNSACLYVDDVSDNNHIFRLIRSRQKNTRTIINQQRNRGE